MARVLVTPAARAQVRDLIDWWRANRPAAARHLPRELRRVLLLLAESPNLGRPYKVASGTEIRAYPLRRTPYAVYYEHDAEAGELHVLAVRSLVRGEGPPLT